MKFITPFVFTCILVAVSSITTEIEFEKRIQNEFKSLFPKIFEEYPNLDLNLHNDHDHDKKIKEYINKTIERMGWNLDSSITRKDFKKLFFNMTLHEHELDKQTLDKDEKKHIKQVAKILSRNQPKKDIKVSSIFNHINTEEIEKAIFIKTHKLAHDFFDRELMPLLPHEDDLDLDHVFHFEDKVLEYMKNLNITMDDIKGTVPSFQENLDSMLAKKDKVRQKKQQLKKLEEELFNQKNDL